jgi:heat shock protein HslJ
MNSLSAIAVALLVFSGVHTSMAQSRGGAAGTQALDGTYWRAVELAGTRISATDPQREAHLQFLQAGRLSGSDSCNRMTGTYTLKGDVVTFGQRAGTQMACANTSDTERAFREAMMSATRLKRAGDRLELFDKSGKRVGLFAGRTQAPGPSTSGLEGTAWQLVKFQGSDDTTLTPDDGSKYTIDFGKDGQLTARIDCNRGRGAWKSSGSSQLQLGPLALTRAFCPPGSLHDQIVKQWPNIRSYVIKNGRLFLSLMADGGIYEFQSRPSASPQPQKQ